MWSMTSVVEYFDWLKKQPVNQAPSTKLTIIYSKVVVLCGCHNFPKIWFYTVQYRCIFVFVLVIWTLIAVHY